MVPKKKKKIQLLEILSGKVIIIYSMWLINSPIAMMFRELLYGKTLEIMSTRKKTWPHLQMTSTSNT